jgi:hypothetical protein
MPPRKARRAAAHGAGDSHRVDQVGGQIGADAIQSNASKEGSRRGVPTANGPSALSVSDGVDLAGSIVPRDGTYFVFDIISMLVGVYPPTIAAMRHRPEAGAHMTGVVRIVVRNPRVRGDDSSALFGCRRSLFIGLINSTSQTKEAFSHGCKHRTAHRGQHGRGD